MPRVGRRGKGLKDNKPKDEVPIIPTKVLSSILNILDFTFERDIGMLNGKNVRSLPERKILVDLKAQLDKLDDLFGTIADSDKVCIDRIREIRDNRNNSKNKNNDDRSIINNNNNNTTSDTGEKEYEKSPSKQEQVKAIESEPLKEEVAKEVAESSKEIPEVMDVTVSVPSQKRPAEDIEKEKEQSSQEEKPIEDEIKLKKPKLDGHVDIDRMENDPFVKNPKSEFIRSQTLPNAARALGLYSEEGLESTGNDYLKKKYHVASYPTNDLKKLLPGELPDMDFSCPKPTNQIQYNTFLSFVDNFYRDLNDDDTKFLKSKYILPLKLQVDKTYDPDVTPFVIPKLGPLYTDTWFKEDSNQKKANTSPPPLNDPTSIFPRKSASDINDFVLETEDVSCGPLVSRLLSAILKEDGNDANNKDVAINATNDHSLHNNIKQENTDNLEMDSYERTPSESTVHTPISEIDEQMTKFHNNGTTSNLTTDPGWNLDTINLDYPTFEERLKRELKYVGIYMNMPKDENNPNGDELDWLNGREDDEISAELRELQNSLKNVTVKNQSRKESLLPLLEVQLAWQEYSSILDDLDKQIDQAYIKRVRVPKKRKKHHGLTTVTAGTASQIAQQKAANSSLRALLDKRLRWITKIGPLFREPEVMKRIPEESVFRDMDQEEDEEDEEADVFSPNTNNKDVELGES
ncbi:hypothetical protein KAFR_0B06050 [Kazachstania africana CBS 2517]|uniref:Uncharacterized protein n=1 Tax=Kazachstania africana (strain ATCC 22294 / BCRC 22015 / CBS 2517 / CECT 1963 / NBRC 1671 / NRRL Y-8276) TaxID=1071382 RepID=H2ARA1_KAZAF|nr:hypothetical protein KAFR_0B06050 [Kazachstania africana CBS 2517]CCF56901.1 hypothetical protein KAFR_0B06050 [Kazachstania africana CBS 2517]